MEMMFSKTPAATYVPKLLEQGSDERMVSIGQKIIAIPAN